MTTETIKKALFRVHAEGGRLLVVKWATAPVVTPLLFQWNVFGYYGHDVIGLFHLLYDLIIKVSAQILSPRKINLLNTISTQG